MELPTSSSKRASGGKRPSGGVLGELLRLVGRLFGAGIASVFLLPLLAFAISVFFGVSSLLVRVVAGEEASKGILEAMPRLFGLFVFVYLMRWALMAHGRMWRRLAEHYGGTPSDPARTTVFPEMVIVNGGGFEFRRYVPLTVGVHARGISLRLAPGFSIGCPPVFLPYEELNLRPSSWYVVGEAWGLRAAKTGDLELVISDRLRDWLRVHTMPGTMDAMRERGRAA